MKRVRAYNTIKSIMVLIIQSPLTLMFRGQQKLDMIFKLLLKL